MPQESIEARLHPQVAGYTSGNYSLLSDLSHLQGVRSVRATEATIFYSARMLEALAAAAVGAAGMTASASSYSNLETLVEFNLVPATTLYWANGLRRLGNDVRHMLRRAEPQDADLAAIFAERWIDWFFRHFRLGLRLPSITLDGEHLVAVNNMALPRLVRAIDAEDFDPTAWLPANWKEGEAPFMMAATLAAVIVDILLDRDESEAAFAVLDPARKRFPDDLRLQQLAVLGWKRRGDLNMALQNVGPLLARSGDDETAGIVGGVFKQAYLDGGGETDMLAKSHRAYRGGWEASKSSNAYLGINAASTALWMGRPAESRRLAEEVRQLLRKRIAALTRGGDQQLIASSYWDEVTLAEAELLLGEVGAGRRRYQAAFNNFAKSKGNIKVALQQAHRLLPALGITLAGKDFFKAEDSAISKPLVIGVTGHRNLPDETAVGAAAGRAIREIRAKAGADAPIVILSSLAAGTDSVVAEVGMKEFGARLRAVLPLEISEYVKDFDGAQRERFQALLNQADAILYPPAPNKSDRGKAPATAPPENEREAAYERAGIYVVDHCEVLLAVWDGLPARGQGGTAEIVAYARRIGRPIAWVGNEEPFELRMELFEKRG